MSDASQNASPQVEPFEDRIDILFRELELAIKWQRPSILFAICGNEDCHRDAEMALEGSLIDLGHKVFRLQIENEESADVTARLSKVANPEQTVFFISGLCRGGGQEGRAAYAALNKHREYFIDQRLRIVFWLMEAEAIALAHHAPDYWAFRHRVIEFVDAPKPEEALSQALESAWQGAGELADTTEELDAKISLRESLLTGLPKGDGATAMNANLYLTLGILHWRRKDHEKAAQYLQTALETAIAMQDKWFEAECLNAIALVYTDLGRTDDAIEAYKQAIQLAPSQIFPWNNLGNLYSKLDRHEEAVEAFHKAIEHNPEDAVSWNGLGNAYFRMGQNEDAITTYHKAAELAPNFVYPWNGLGNVYASAGRIEEAIEAYQKAIKVNRRVLNPWIGLGNAFIKQGNNEGALKAYQTALDLDPKNAQAWIGLGDAHRRLNEGDKAAAAFQKAAELGAEPALLALEKLPEGEAQAVGQTTLTPDPGAGEGPVEMAPAAAPSAPGSPQPGEPKAEQDPAAEDAQPSHDQAAQGAGQADRLGESQPGQAETVPQPGSKESEVDMENESKKAYEWNKLGHIHLKAGSYDEAIAAYIKAIEASPELSWPYIHNLALAHYHKGEQKGKAGALPLSEPAIRAAQVAQPDPVEAAPVAAKEEDSAPQAAQAVVMEEEPAPVVRDEPPEDPVQVLQEVEVHQGPSASIGQDEPAGEMGDWLRSLEAVKGPSADQPEVTSDHFLSDALQEDLYGFGQAESGSAAVPETSPEASASPVPEPIDPEAPTVVHRVERPVEPVADEPKDAYEWNELGNIHLKAGACDRAIQAYERAIALSPEFGWPYSNLGLAYSHKGKYAEALPLFRKSIELLRNNKEKAITWNRMGDAYRRLNDHDRAVKAYQKAIELDKATNSLLKRVRLSLLGNARA